VSSVAPVASVASDATETVDSVLLRGNLEPGGPFGGSAGGGAAELGGVVGNDVTLPKLKLESGEGLSAVDGGTGAPVCASGGAVGTDAAGLLVTPEAFVPGTVDETSLIIT
jgi:hypothetical protein